MTLRLGPLTLRNPWLLAPMEAVSDCAFRRLCHSLGASFTWTEMVRGSSLLRGNRSTLALIDTFDGGVPTGLQLLTAGPEELRETLHAFFALREREGYAHLANVRAIDLNFGCPDPALLRKGQGPAMVKRTTRMEAIFRVLGETVRAADPSIAVGAKLRLGLNQREKRLGVALRLAPAADAHLDYLIVHGKHAGERGSDPADREALRAFRERLSIPFIANGGALDADGARALLACTGADGVLIARGAIRNPWIFRALAGTGPERASTSEMRAAMLRYRDDAARLGTKRKYAEFHAQNFSRMLQD